jgi:hypothetical protein
MATYKGESMQKLFLRMIQADNLCTTRTGRDLSLQVYLFIFLTPKLFNLVVPRVQFRLPGTTNLHMERVYAFGFVEV